MPTELLPMVLPPNGDDPRQLGLGEALAGSSKVIDLVNYAAGLLSITSLTDGVVAGSDFLWSAGYLPAGRSIYLELNANAPLGLGLTAAGITATLYTLAGVAVAGSTVSTVANQTPTLVRSAAFALAAGTTYQLRVRVASTGTGSLRLARLIID